MGQFEDMTTSLASTPRKIVITRDFNLHDDVNSAPGVSRFTDLLKAHGLLQYVDCATHNAGHSFDLVISRASDDLLNKVLVISRMDKLAPLKQRRPRKRITPSWYCEELQAMRKLRLPNENI